MSNGVQVAQRVRVGVETENNQIFQFFSYVKKIYDERLVLVFSESNSHFEKYLVESSTVRLSIYTPIGVLLAEAIIINSAKNCEFEVEMLQQPKRIQRRRYVRANAHYRLIIEQNEKNYTALTCDIGGGGVRFLCDSGIDYVFSNAKLFIPEIKEGLAFSGTVEKKSYYKKDEYLIQFEQIEEKTRNKIIQKCLELQAENLRKNS